MLNLTIALGALLVSLLSFSVAFAAFRLAKRQDERKRPVLVPYLMNGYVQSSKDKKDRVYSFLLSINNPSDSDNALAAMELHITYKITTETQVTTRLRSSSSVEDVPMPPSEYRIISTPARVDAHQTLTGWSMFRAPAAILEGAAIESYKVALFDTHGIEASITPIMVQELP
ncbi:MAG: hypothetical protein GY789_10845 [Hyphomicrobiales bacterium]|nr:hypothetical protein [Hyphomicrobiales bacterium]